MSLGFLISWFIYVKYWFEEVFHIIIYFKNVSFFSIIKAIKINVWDKFPWNGTTFSFVANNNDRRLSDLKFELYTIKLKFKYILLSSKCSKNGMSICPETLFWDPNYNLLKIKLVSIGADNL